MIVSTDMTVTFGVRCADLAQNDDACGASIDAQCAASAHIVVDDEKNMVGWVGAGHLCSGCLRYRIRRDHVDAFPWTDVDASFAHDAFALIDVDELLRLDGFAQIIGIHLNELILG